MSGLADHDSACLAPDELQRAARFQFPVHKNRFVASRVWLRSVLAQFTNSSPTSLQFEQHPLGKPFLVEPKTGLEFNFSRSEMNCICAATQGCKIGIDIENVRPLSDMHATALTIFDDADFRAWSTLDNQEQQFAFFRSWTRKEAIAKANGAGISLGVENIKVPVSKLPLASFQRTTVDGMSYLFSDLDVEPNIAASVAMELEPHETFLRYEDLAKQMLKVDTAEPFPETHHFVGEIVLQQ